MTGGEEGRIAEPGFRSGFVALIGRPNVGKSALLNRLVGSKVAITASKPQTTRHRILGVVSGPDSQVVLIDTPGIHEPKHLLGQRMVRTAKEALRETEAVLMVVEAQSRPGPGDEHVARYLENLSCPVFCALNKIDLLPARESRSAAGRDYAALARFRALIATSALTGEGLPSLLGALREVMPPGPRYFPPGVTSDQPEGIIFAELVREKLIELTEQEVPHSLAVVTEELVERREGLVYLRCVIYVERPSQRMIVLGAGGLKLKEAGRQAREELEHLLGSRVFLDLWVKVKPNWRNRQDELARLGFR